MFVCDCFFRGVAVRKRKREERIKSTADQIARMKKRQEESERWRARKRGLQPYVIGLSIALVVGGYLFYKYYVT